MVLRIVKPLRKHPDLRQQDWTFYNWRGEARETPAHVHPATASASWSWKTATSMASRSLPLHRRRHANSQAGVGQVARGRERTPTSMPPAAVHARTRRRQAYQQDRQVRPSDRDVQRPERDWFDLLGSAVDFPSRGVGGGLQSTIIPATNSALKPPRPPPRRIRITRWGGDADNSATVLNRVQLPAELR